VNETAGKAQLFVNRVNGADGCISVGWKTKDLTAVNGKDYIGGEGTLLFEHGETSKSLEIHILDSGVRCPTKNNLIFLSVMELKVLF